MAPEHSIHRYRRWYAQLLRLYSRLHYERFGEGMEQTFNDLLKERAKKDKGLIACVLWMFIETTAGIVRERVTAMTTQSRNIVRIMLATAFVLLIPLVAMQFTDEVTWDLFDFLVMGTVLIGVGLAYELIAKRVASGMKLEKTVYRVAFGIGLAGAFLLFWVNGAVGIIGNEGQSANLMYGAVFVVGLIGSLLARFKPRGMARTLFAAALVQISIPVIALIVWPGISWGGAGIAGVFAFNAFFVALFVVSAMLFRHAAATSPN